MSSSSSEDEFNAEALREAVANDFLPDDIYNKTPKEGKKVDKTSEKSLRSSRNEEDNFSNLLGVTPEFQKHVAKHLVNILDERLKSKVQIDCVDTKKKKKPKGGIKLFNGSNDYIKIFKHDIRNRNETVKRKETSYDEEAEMKKIKSVVVDPNDVLSKKETLHWSNRSKAHIFRYRRKNNVLCLNE